ncbi:hypothetical protein [Nonomuraea sp. NPDC003709]|uniref:hypothetical protein n=1 Tax=Nonomuraea sp. NPDC003709 TaxID=3154450 RepID=UPI0033B1FD58
MTGLTLDAGRLPQVLGAGRLSRILGAGRLSPTPGAAETRAAIPALVPLVRAGRLPVRTPVSHRCRSRPTASAEAGRFPVWKPVGRRCRSRPAASAEVDGPPVRKPVCRYPFDDIDRAAQGKAIDPVITF